MDNKQEFKVVEVLRPRHDERATFYRFSEKPEGVGSQVYLLSLQEFSVPVELLSRSQSIALVACKEFRPNKFGWVSVEGSVKDGICVAMLEDVLPSLNLKVGDWVWMELWQDPEFRYLKGRIEDEEEADGKGDRDDRI